MAIDPDVQGFLDVIDGRLDQLEATSQLAVGVNITDFGAVGDGATDDLPAFQAAADALSRGEALSLPPSPQGRGYRLSGPVGFAADGVRIVGGGGVSRGEAVVFSGAAVLVEGPAGFVFNEGGTLSHLGPTLDHVNFIDTSPAGDATLVKIDNMNYWSFDRCVFRANNLGSDTAGIGIKLTGAGDNSWGTIDTCHFFYCGRGIDADMRVGGGNNIFGGSMLVRDGQRGIYLGPWCQSTHVDGMKFDGQRSPIIEIEGGHNSIAGCRFEQGTPQIRISDNGGIRGSYNLISGNDFFYTSQPPDGTAVLIEDAACRKNLIANNIMLHFNPTDTPIVDNGTGTVVAGNVTGWP